MYTTNLHRWALLSEQILASSTQRTVVKLLLLDMLEGEVENSYDLSSLLRKINIDKCISERCIAELLLYKQINDSRSWTQ